MTALRCTNYDQRCIFGATGGGREGGGGGCLGGRGLARMLVLENKALGLPSNEDLCGNKF